MKKDPVIAQRVVTPPVKKPVQQPRGDQPFKDMNRVQTPVTKQTKPLVKQLKPETKQSIPGTNNQTKKTITTNPPVVKNTEIKKDPPLKKDTARKEIIIHQATV